MKKGIKKIKILAALISIFTLALPVSNIFYNNTSKVEAADFSADETFGWKQSSAGPEARRGHSAVFSNFGGKNEMIIFGGLGAKHYDDVWIFDLNNETWKEITTFSDNSQTNGDFDNDKCFEVDENGIWQEVTCQPIELPPKGPAKRTQHTAAYDPASDTMYVFGGWQLNSSVFRDFWALVGVHTANPTWVKKENPPIAYGFRNSSAVWAGDKMIIFGGVRDNSRISKNTLLYGAGTWVKNEGTPSTPSARYLHSAVWTESGMIIYGGRNATAYYDDAWILSGGNWRKIISKNNPTARAGMEAFYDQKTDQMLIFGGVTKGLNYKNEAWILKKASDIFNAVWENKIYNNAPSERIDYGGVYNGTDTILIFGGDKKGLGVLGDTHKLKFLIPPTPPILIPPTPPTLNKIESSCLSNSNPDNIIFWNDNSDNEDNFNIYRSNQPFATNPINPTEGTPVLLNFKNTNSVKSPPEQISSDFEPISNTTYYYRIKAENNEGAKWSLSNEASAATKDCGPKANPKSLTTPEDTPLAFEIDGNDQEGKLITYKLKNLPVSGTLKNTAGIISGTLPISLGDSLKYNLTYTPNSNYAGWDSFEFSVTDNTGAESANARVDIEVTSVSDSPILDPIGNKSVTENELLTFTISATDLDSPSLTYSAINLPLGATFDAATKTFTWTPNINQGDQKPTKYPGIIFRVSDGINKDEETIEISVNNANRAPTASDQSVTTKKNTAINITLSASDSDGDTLTYTPTFTDYIPPRGSVTLKTAPNIFTYTPATDFLGDYAFTFSVNDGTVNSGNAIVRIKILDSQNPLLSINGLGSGTGNITSSPAGINCDTNNGLESGTCVFGFEKNTTITLTATPAAGNHKFINWSDNCVPIVNAPNQCKITISTDATVDSKFYLPTFKLEPATKIIDRSFHVQYEGYYDEDGLGTEKPTLTTEKINGIRDIPYDNISWESSNTNIVVISFGEATGLLGGTVKINGTYKNIKAEADLTVNPDPILTIEKQGTGTGIVRTPKGESPGNEFYGINCGGGDNNCSEPYSKNEVVEIKSTADANSTFKGLSGHPDCPLDIFSKYSVSMSENKTCIATFDLNNELPKDKPVAEVSIKNNLTDIDRALIGDTFYADVANSKAPEKRVINKISFCFDNTPSNDTCDNTWTEFFWNQTNGDWTAKTSLKLTGYLVRLGTWAAYVKVQDSSDIWSDIVKDTVQMSFALDANTNCIADFTSDVFLSWIKPNQAETDTTGIQIFRKTGLNGTYAQIGSNLANNINFYQDKTVSNSTSYYYKVRYLRANDDIDSSEKDIITGSCAPTPSNYYLDIQPYSITSNPGDYRYYAINVSTTNYFSPVTVYLHGISAKGPNNRNKNDIKADFTKNLSTYEDTLTLNFISKDNKYETGYLRVIDSQITDLRGDVFSINLFADKSYLNEFYINQRPNAYFHAITPISGDAPLTVTFKDGKIDGTPSDGGKDISKSKFARGNDIVLHLGDLNGNDVWDHCYSVRGDIDCKKIVEEILPNGESYKSGSWDFTYTENATAKYCVIDDLVYETGDPKKSMGCSTSIDITITQKPVAENKNVTVGKNSVKNIISLNGLPVSKNFIYKITSLPTNGKLYDQNNVELTTCSVTTPCVLNSSLPSTSIKTFYTPNTEYTGPDEFKFKVNNGKKDSDEGIISINVVEMIVNQPPVAEASIILGEGRNCDPDDINSGPTCSFTNPLIVNKGETVTIVSYGADKDINGDGKASDDPNGWTHPDFGVSNGGKCEWNKNFTGNKNLINEPIVYDTLLPDPLTPTACNLDKNTVTFNESFKDDEAEILKITDKGGLSSASIVKVIVRPAPPVNEAPVAEASFVVGTERYSFNKTLIVNEGDKVEITSFDAHIDINGDGKASYDPNDWGNVTNGVSNGGKCEWNKDFNLSGAYNEAISNPPLPVNCSVSGSFNVTFNTPSSDQTNGDPFTILRITDRGNLFGVSAVRVLVKGGDDPNLIISAGPAVNSGDLTEDNTITFKGTVSNNGNEDAKNNFSNEFGIDLGNDGSVDDRLPKININKLDKGDSKEIISGNWKAVKGTHRIVLCADSDNSIDESNEADNCSVGVITIEPKCTDECSPEDSETCVTQNSFKTCGNFDADPCLELSLTETDCGANETCVQDKDDAKCLLLPIISFSANPTTIKKGDSSTLTWDTKNIIPANGDSCTASNSENYAEWKGNVNPSGTKPVTPAKTTKYTLTCENSLKAVSESVTIRVQSKPPIEI